MRAEHYLLGALITVCSCGNGPQIMIGAILSQTGSLATSGQDHLQAAQLAADQINAAGGLLGQRLVIVNQDDHSLDSDSPAAAMALINREHVPAIIGAVTSGSTYDASMVTSANHVVLISGSATAITLSHLSDYLFRTCPPDNLQAKLLAERAVAKHFTNNKVAILYDPGTYGAGLAQEFTKDFTMLGGTVAASISFAPGGSSYVSQLQQIFASTPDAVLLVAYARDGAQIIRDYNTHFIFMQTFWFFTDSTEDTSFVQGVGASGFTFMHEGTGTATPSGPLYASFVSQFTTQFGHAPQGYSPNYYDATWLVALAAQAAGKADGASIQASMRAVADPPGMIVGPGQWSIAVAALKQGAKVDYDGASGSVDIDANGDVLAPYDIWQVQGGQITSIQKSVLP